MQCRSLKQPRAGDPNVAYGDKAQQGDGKWRKREKSRRGSAPGEASAHVPPTLTVVLFPAIRLSRFTRANLRRVTRYLAQGNIDKFAFPTFANYILFETRPFSAVRYNFPPAD